MMKKHWKAIGSGFVCIMALLAVVFGFLATHPLVQDEQNNNVQTAALPGYDARDNYIILEIVPDSCYKQLGYLLAGSEPVDIFEVSNAGEADKIEKIAGNGVQLVNQINGVQYKQLEEVYGTDKVEDNFIKTVSGAGAYAKQTKYELKDKKYFPINKNLIVDRFEGLIQDKGVEDIQIISVTSDDLNNASIDKVEALIKDADVIIMNQSFVKGAEPEQEALGTTYVKNSQGGKTFVDKDLDWKVAKAIFNQISNKKNPATIFMDSSIYTNALDKSDKTVKTVQYKLNREVKYEDGQFNNGYQLVGNNGLFNKTDFEAGNSKASDNNTYKLFLMSMFRDPIEFYNLFMESGLIKSGGEYQLQSGDAGSYWNTYTFLPCTGDLASDNGEFKKANEDYWKNSMGITLNLDSKNYINCNIVSWDTSKESFISGLNNSQNFKDSVKNTSKEYKLINLINLLKDYTPKANVDGKEYKVLELQPAKGYDLSPVVIERMIPYTSYSNSSSISLKITKMATAEFIGRTDELTSCYDMIYIGNNTDGLWKKDGKTYYGANNDDMIGMIYAHVGAKVNFNYGIATDTSTSGENQSNGWALFNSGDSGSLRYSGNDITNLKKKDFETYLATGLPIVVASGLCEDAMKSKPDFFYVPEHNNMRNFLKENKDDLMDLQFNYRTASAKDLEKQLSRLTMTKPTLTVTAVSGSGRASGAAGSYTGSDLNKTMEFTFTSTTNRHQITISYKIDDEGAGNDYTLELYVDKNADGRFVSTERVGKRAARSGSNQSYAFNVNTNYRGALTWKLVVYPNNNKTLKCSQEGYATIRFDDVTGGKKVKVLQVQAVKEGDNKHTTTWGYEKAQQLNLQVDTYFKALFDEIREDYDIEVEAITMQEFTWGNGSQADGYWGSGHTRKTMQNDYQMIIFGFADSYRDMEFDNANIAKDIDDYITAGKSVLFTHDLTSQINNVTIMGQGGKYMETTNGRGFNKYMRDRMGLNRFDQDVRAGSAKASKAYDSMTSGTDKYGFTYTTLMQYSNFKHAWHGDVGDINKKVKDAGFYGPYNNLLVSLNTNNGGDNKGWPDIYSGHYWNYGNENDKIRDYSANTNIQGYGTNFITNVNNGQITSYPFDLSKESGDITSDGRYKTALTHGQYYQLNMEDEEIVCWYTLSDQNSKGEGWYSTSPNDVSNNYYIYNKGNVTYTGVGHSNSGAMTVFERKLFVNTIVAALRAGIEGPGATITNGYNVPEGGEDRFVVYADVDVDSGEDEFNKREKVEFYATDDGTKETKVYVTIEWCNEDTGTWEEKTPSQLDSLGIKIKAASGSSSPQKVTFTRKDGTKEGYLVDKSDESTNTTHGYILEIPRKYLKDHGTQNFRIRVYDKEGALGYTNGALIRRPLFNLD
ncbi:MAG: DUF5057 domain-containing protein [Lachnospiraceae bacterium]|nr:DUF5057 domain-containing protein [Lachnospiraceae bacterium]